MSNDIDENLTTSTKERWEWIGTILASATVLSLPTLIIGAATEMLSLSSVGQAWFALYATVTLMAATWAFGRETLNAVQKARSN